jgi:hypothetical protein|nr:hypothetical protein [Candidatus Pacearchaeota archaeon]
MADQAKPKAKRTVKPVYAIMSVVDSDGNQISGLSRESVTIHSVVKSADEVLEMVESGTLPAGSFYKRIALA